MMQQSGAEPKAAALNEHGAAHQGQEDRHGRGGLISLVIGSIGVVYGDIGTSPLYALRESLSHAVKADALTEQAVMGAISLLIFALVFTVTIKYVLFLMRADNRGEGGTLSLMALAESAVGGRSLYVFLLGVAGRLSFPGTLSSPQRFRSCRRSRAWSWSRIDLANTCCPPPFLSS